MTDEDLIKGCLDRNRSSQKALYDKYAPLLLGLCMRYVKSKEDAEDVLIEGFMKIFTHLDSYEPRSTLLAWMKKVMVNTALNYQTKNKKYQLHVSFDDLEYEPVAEGQSFCEIDEHFSQNDLLRLIQQMPDYMRVVLNLRAFEGWEYADIAEAFNISEITARSRFSKAKKWLEDRIL
jgi:RNA polymerase sigma-70 factor (ECF subfamily)